MSGFQKHNIGHSSASQINMWEESPAAWVARYLYNKKFHFGVAPQIGILTEDVVADVLCGDSFEVSLGRAKEKFLKDNAFNTSEKDMKRIDDIEAMALQALEYLKPYGEPEFINKLTGREQQKIEIKCNGDGWELPIIGYLDFVYPKEGIIFDLKTTLRCPSSLSGAHARQAAIYRAARGNMAVKFLYVTPKKFNVLELEDYAPVLAEVKTILNRQEKMLRAFNKEELRSCAPLGLSSFFWNGSENIKKELYGV